MENRDIGYLQGSTQVNVPIDNIKRTQVYQATHDGAGNRLPFMNRSFISFSYGGRYIEDFGAIGVIDGDRLSHAVYADFVDNVTDSNIFDGQIYWSSHFKANAWDLTLATDGMTENQLDDFKQWFKPGKIRELILAEHPHRAIMARISKTLTYSVIPFEGKISTIINGQTYISSTTLYKGNITISFVMDDPFWYSTSNILNIFDSTGVFSNYWSNANNEEEFILESNDAIKIIVEDNIPIISMMEMSDTVPASFINTILLGNGQLYEVDDSTSSTGSLIQSAQIGYGHIAYVYTATAAGINIGTAGNSGYFYYGGTAPCAPILTFTVVPKIDSTTKYITSPCNSFSSTTSNPYNIITIESINKTDFKFTTPSILTGYNQVINIFRTIGEGVAWEDVKIALRDNVKHYAPRSYGIYVIDQIRGATTTTTSTLLTQACTNMTNFLKDGNNIVPIIFTIDCKTGKATALMSYRNNENSLITRIENVGDMVLSNYLKIEDRNKLNENGQIVPWSEDYPEYSHRIYTDIADGLSNVNLEYKYLYL